MTALALLGKHLKSDEVIEFLELHDVQVMYDFDRLHENLPDYYWAAAKAAGLQLRFNEQQIVDTIFCYVDARDGFSPTEVASIGVPVFNSRQQAESALRASGANFTSSSPPYDWVRSHGSEHDVHFEFKHGRLSLVTLMLAAEV